jgi:poly(3-hydroxybutyrate) depolymerase
MERLLTLLFSLTSAVHQWVIGRPVERGARPAILAATAALLLLSGCAVPQPRGNGQLHFLREPRMQRGYWLYLPHDYVRADDAFRQQRRWPLVVTFHGMKPFDQAHAQAREWQQEADRYGFIVVAPELMAPNVLRQFPVREITPAFKSDESATLAILDHVYATTLASREHVLSTSWSSGGYLAHYMLNRHPERFTCLAVRQSNFSVGILDPALVPRSRDHALLVLTTQNDFGNVKQETAEAIKWYEGHGYGGFAWIEIKGLGHERTPDMAAAFFGHFAGVRPNSPPAVLSRRQAIAGNARGLALLAATADSTPALAQVTAPPLGAGTPTPGRSSSAHPVRASLGQPGTAARSNPGSNPTAGAQTPSRDDSARRAPRPRSPLSIRVSSAIGTEPLALAFAAECPADWRARGNFLWTLNGDPIGSGVNGQKTITEPGEHTLGLLVITASGEEHRAFRLVRVLPRIERARSTSDPRDTARQTRQDRVPS